MTARYAFLMLLIGCSTASPKGPDFEGPGTGDDDGISDPGDPTDPGVDPDDTDTLPTYPTEHPRIYLTPNRTRLEAALATGTPAATRFRAKVNSWMAGADIWGYAHWNTALLGQLTGDTTYCTRAVAAVDASVAADEAKIAAGSAPAVQADSYLYIGDYIGDVALVYDWCHDQVAQGQRTRWLAYANQAIWNVWHHADAQWGGKAFPWSGWSVDNPGNNYYYSFLRATMLMGLAFKGEDPQADDWIAKFRDDKILGQLVPMFDEQLVGGGSREGTGYGVSMRHLFGIYDFWKATTGESLATKTTHTRRSLRTYAHQIMPTLDSVAPIGDHSRDSTCALFDYDRQYLQELVALFPNDPMSAPVTGMLAGSAVPEMGQGFMIGFDFLYEPTVQPTTFTGVGTAYYAHGIGELYARSGWDRHATWVNLIAGPYTETHAHQDQGSIMIFKDGWLAYDPIIHSHSGIPQETTVHGLVRIDSGGAPVQQKAWTTSSMEALHSGPGWVYAAADVTAAYDGNSAVQLVQREMVYLQPDVVVVYDRVRSSAGTTQTWQLPSPASPAIAGATATFSASGHALHVTRIAGPSVTASTYDYRSNSDFTAGFRYDERAAGGDQRYLHVLAIDGAATSTAAAGADGVTVHLSDNRTVTVAFNRDAIGGTLTVDAAGGGTATTLAPGVDALAE